MKREKWLFDQLPLELELVSKEQQVSLKGGSTGYEWATDPAGNFYYRENGSDTWTAFSMLNTVNITNDATGGSSSGGGFGGGSGGFGGGGSGGGGGGDGSSGGGSNNNHVSNALSVASLMAIGITSEAFAGTLSAALLPFAEVLIPLGIMGYIAKSTYDSMSGIYAYDRGLPWNEPKNPYNNTDGGMNPFPNPNGDNFGNALKAALVAAGLLGVYDEIKDYLGKLANPVLIPSPLVPPPNPDGYITNPFGNPMPIIPPPQQQPDTGGKEPFQGGSFPTPE